MNGEERVSVILSCFVMEGSEDVNKQKQENAALETGQGK